MIELEPMSMAAARSSLARVVTMAVHPYARECHTVVSCVKVYRLDARATIGRRATPLRGQRDRERDDMATENTDITASERAIDLLAAGAEDELRLLKRERKAEQRLARARATLADDEQRLERARQRVDASEAAVAAAEAQLREAQRLRAAGPDPVHD